MNQNSSGRVTLKDIAVRCGYTANTVSRALRGDKKLPENTRETICRLAREMGYVPNSSARALRYGSSRTIAVIVNDINNPYYANMLSQIDQLLKEKNYRTMILCTQLDEELASAMIQLAISQTVDGILFFPFNNAQHIHELHASGIPFVMMDRWIPHVQADIARIDDFGAGYTMASHLLELGHRSLLYMAGPFVNSSQVDRQNGITEALIAAGLDVNSHLRILPWDSIPADPSRSEVIEQMKPFDYTAVLAFNDVLAYHAMNAIHTSGMRVPEDISVVGIDHIRWRNTYLPPLSSITVSGQSVAKAAIDLLFSRIDQPDLPFRHVVLPVTLHLSGTTQAPQTRNKTGAR
ncbi:MAG: LacI family DNA-binding transcriptional regulator [Clostridia bacterium]|nr:LacI family DNA-binding transcriptional regulator [Clostridia bacterium]